MKWVGKQTAREISTRQDSVGKMGNGQMWDVRDLSVVKRRQCGYFMAGHYSRLIGTGVALYMLGQFSTMLNFKKG